MTTDTDLDETTSIRISTELVHAARLIAANETALGKKRSMRDIVDEFVRNGVQEWLKATGTKLPIKIK